MAQMAGEERKQEALKRREEFVIKKSEARTQSVKTTQQLHKEREDIIQREVCSVSYNLEIDSRKKDKIKN